MKGFLIVDDEPAMHQLYKRMIKKHFDAVVFTADDGEEAEDMLCKINPAIDVVISDINHPGKNGIDLAKDIYKKYPNIKIFIVSGNLSGGRKEKSEKLLKTGVIKGLLQKPFKIPIFSDILKKCCN
jgi:two-component system response regulator YesN